MVGSKNSEWLNTASLDWESTSSNPLFLIYWMALWEKIVLEKLLRYVGKNSNSVRIFHTTGSLKLFGSVVSSYVDTWYLKMEGFWFSFWLWFLIQTFKRIMPLLVIILGLLRSSLFQRDVTLFKTEDSPVLVRFLFRVLIFPKISRKSFLRTGDVVSFLIRISVILIPLP